MKYKCVKQFELPGTDEDGNAIENEHEITPKGSIWEMNNRNNMVDGELHLDIVNGECDFSWIEIDKETLTKYFKRINGSEED